MIARSRMHQLFIDRQSFPPAYRLLKPQISPRKRAQVGREIWKKLAPKLNEIYLSPPEDDL